MAFKASRGLGGGIGPLWEYFPYADQWDFNKPHLIIIWCIGLITAAFSAAMENRLPDDERYPVASLWWPPMLSNRRRDSGFPGQVCRQHCEYEKNGSCVLLLAIEPKTCDCCSTKDIPRSRILYHEKLPYLNHTTLPNWDFYFWIITYPAVCKSSSNKNVMLPLLTKLLLYPPQFVTRYFPFWSADLIVCSVVATFAVGRNCSFGFLEFQE